MITLMCVLALGLVLGGLVGFFLGLSATIECAENEEDNQ